MKPTFLLPFPLLALLLPGFSTAAPVDQSFSYDALGRLTNTTGTSYTHDPAGNITQITSPVSPSLFVTPGTANLVWTPGSTASVNLTANVAWSAVSNQTWLTLAPASGSSDVTLTLTATTANPGPATRSATVTISGGSLPNQTVTVTQAAPPLTLTATPGSNTVPATAQSNLSFTLTAPGAWTASSNQTWLTLTTPSGPGSGSVTYSVTANTATSPRTATITINSQGQQTNFTLSQQGTGDDHGNSIATATPIPGTQTSAGGTLNPADEDYFRIPVPGAGTLIVWTAGTTDTTGYLYNAAGTQLATNTDSDLGPNFRASAAVTSGNYFARVTGASAVMAGPYTLHYRFIPATAPIQITYFEKAGTTINIGFTGTAGTLYIVASSSNLSTWADVSTTTATGAENMMSLSNQGAQPKQYFRVTAGLPASVAFATGGAAGNRVFRGNGSTPVPAGCLLRLGTMSNPADFSTFSEFGTSAIGNSVVYVDGVISGTVTTNRAANFSGQPIYIVIYNAPTAAASTEACIFKSTESFMAFASGSAQSLPVSSFTTALGRPANWPYSYFGTPRILLPGVTGTVSGTPRQGIVFNFGGWW